MGGLRIAVDLRGADPTRPSGPTRYARILAGLMLEQAGEHQVTLWDPGTPVRERDADVVVRLDGRPGSGGAPSVLAVYDLSHLLTPGVHGLLERVRRSWAVAVATRRADRLLAPSQLVARALVDYLRLPPGRVTWIPTIGPGWRRAPRADVEALRAELELKPDYFLFVGSLSKRKNLDLLLRAWDRVRPVIGDRCELVLAGSAQGAGSRILAQAIAGGARWLGYLPDEQLTRLLSGALAWVSPSRFEGCSMGALEAMSLGAPPIVASGTAFAEVVGSAGTVVGPDDVDGWAAAIRTMFEDRAERNRMAARGLRAVADLRASEAGRRALEAAAAACRTGS